MYKRMVKFAVWKACSDSFFHLKCQSTFSFGVSTHFLEPKFKSECNKGPINHKENITRISCRTFEVKQLYFLRTFSNEYDTVMSWKEFVFCICIISRQFLLDLHVPVCFPVRHPICLLLSISVVSQFGPSWLLSTRKKGSKSVRLPAAWWHYF